MFLFTEINYRLTRTLGRTVVLALAALMLVASMGAYLGSLQASQAALLNLAESIPVTARVLNRMGTASTRLSIEAADYDALTAMDVHGVLATAGAAGAISDALRAQDPFMGGDVTVTGANCWAALPAVREEDVEYVEGQNAGFLAGAEAYCALSDEFAQEQGLALGDELSLPVYLTKFSEFGERYNPIGAHTLQVAAIYPYAESNGQRTPQMTVPVGWLRSAAEAAGLDFTYGSLSVVLDQPLYLTRFKEGLRASGFQEVETGETFSMACDAVSVEDELFIKTAEELRENLRTYRAFQLPFFGLVTVMVMLSVFLVLRGSRRDMAIASSLGEAKLRISFVHFSAAVLTQMAGGIVAATALVWRMGIGPGDSLWILLVYLLCASLGTVLALLALLRFDTLAMLTKTD